MFAAPTWLVILLAFVVYALRRTMYIVSKMRGIPGVPRYFCILEPLTPIINLFPQTSLNPTMNHVWTQRTRYNKLNSEVLLLIPLLWGDVTLYCASPEALKQLLNEPFKWVKPEKGSILGTVMGANVVSTNGEQWRKHRKITAPAFDNQIYHDVWTVTANLYKQMLDSPAWKSSDHHYCRDFSVFTTRMALLVITTCGFNMSMNWEGSHIKDGLVESVDSTIVTVANSLLPRLILPRWVFKLPVSGLQQIDRSFVDLQNFLKGEVSSKREEFSDQNLLDVRNKNLFTRVVMSSLQEGTKGLDDDGIIGNLFIYLFAGHETTASAMVITLALLAIDQEEQERVYRHIIDAVGLRDLNYEDFKVLLPVLHCFHEMLRLYPPAPILARVSNEDCSLVAPNLTPGSDTLFLPRDTELMVDFIAAGLNPRTFEDPDRFYPLRWSTSDLSAEDLLSFSTGTRGCLGRKFSTVESVCFLTHLLRDWKFDIKLGENETRLEWHERVMKRKVGVTMKIDKIPLLVTRRSGM